MKRATSLRENFVGGLRFPNKNHRYTYRSTESEFCCHHANCNECFDKSSNPKRYLYLHEEKVHLCRGLGFCLVDGCGNAPATDICLPALATTSTPPARRKR